MALKDAVSALRRSWAIIVALTVLGAGVGALAAVLTPAQYQATTRQFVTVRAGGTSGDLVAATDYAKQAVSSFVIAVPTAIVLQPVIDSLKLPVSVTELAEQVTASTPLDTQTVMITVTDADPHHAVKLADAIAASFASVVTTQLAAPLTGADTAPVTVTTISDAAVPTAPSTPGLLFDLAQGALVGLVLGLAAAGARVFLDTRIRTTDDLESAVDASVLGAIPFDAAVPRYPLAVRDDPHGASAEAFRALRTAMEYLAIDSGAPTVVITSAAPAEGKSTTAANLAMAVAETGVRVALVDADLRSPSLADMFGLEGGIGLSDALADNVPLSQVLRRWGPDKLFILPAGTHPPNPAELLGSDAMAKTVAELARVFDVVILDAPPVLPVTDAAVLATQCTGAVLVAGSGSARRPQVQSAAAALGAAGARLLGTVLTRVPLRGADRYGYAPHAETDAVA